MDEGTSERKGWRGAVFEWSDLRLLKAFVLSITVHSPLNYTVHWYDDTRTEVVMYSNIEDYRYTASYFDGQAMRDNCYRKKYVKKG